MALHHRVKYMQSYCGLNPKYLEYHSDTVLSEVIGSPPTRKYENTVKFLIWPGLNREIWDKFHESGVKITVSGRCFFFSEHEIGYLRPLWDWFILVLRPIEKNFKIIWSWRFKGDIVSKLLLLILISCGSTSRNCCLLLFTWGLIFYDLKCRICSVCLSEIWHNVIICCAHFVMSFSVRWDMAPCLYRCLYIT